MPSEQYEATVAALGEPGLEYTPVAMAVVDSRPACGAVARAINTQSDSFSLGCAGMRTFTEVSPNVALFVIPGCNLVEMAEALSGIVDSNKDMLKHYQEKRNAVA